MNKLMEKYKAGEVVTGTWMQTPSADFAELAAAAGFDFCVVDMEHTEIGLESLSDIFRGLRGSNCCLAVRVSSDGLMDIRRPLDLGANVMMVPLINTAEQARSAVASAKYPPEGVRGYAFCRANNWGMDFDQYIKTCNADLLLLMMIESRQGVENIDEILEVPGVDGVLIGPYDLSGSYGISGELDAPEVQEAIRKVSQACKRHNKVAGQFLVCPTRENFSKAIKEGYRFIPLGMDVIFMRDGLKECVQIANEALKK